MRRRRRKRRALGEVELNLAAMLDMAFQLLAFFILTYRPAPVEGQIALRLPPPHPITGVVSGAQAGADVSNPNPLKDLNTLVISVFGSPDGHIASMAVGDTQVTTLHLLNEKLRHILSDPGIGFEQVILQVGPSYQELMRVVEVCTRQKLPNGEPLTKLSFVELPAE